MTNYTALQASIASWLDRSDQTANIPDFIKLAESTINSELRIRDMVTVSTLATVADQDYVSLPADWLEFKYIKHEGRPLEYITPDGLRSQFEDTGKIRFYSIEGSRLLLNPTPGAITLDIAYYSRIPALSDTATNAVLTKYPQIYLFKSLAFAWQFVMDAAKAAQFEAMYQAALSHVESQEQAAAISGSPLRIRTR